MKGKVIRFKAFKDSVKEHNITNHIDVYQKCSGDVTKCPDHIAITIPTGPEDRFECYEIHLDVEHAKQLACDIIETLGSIIENAPTLGSYREDVEDEYKEYEDEYKEYE